MAVLHVLTGTSGFSYKEWKGSFYPQDLSNSDMLAYYSRRLAAVEINNTFYRLPRKDVIESWADQVPDDFRFVLKASRRITHFKRLKPPYDETLYLLDTARGLANKLGAVLFQLPPTMKKEFERLEAFLEVIPRDMEAAFEFRNSGWLHPEVYELMRTHGRALVHADTDEQPVTEIVETADWGYLRLRRPGYSDADLQSWKRRIQGTSWRKVFVFFKHEDEGAGPQMAERFGKITVSK